jgi:hypothetical protein
MLIKPALKTGVAIFPPSQSHQLRIGTRFRFCTLPNYWSDRSTRHLIELFNGQRTIPAIALAAGVPETAVQSLVDELATHDLVDLHRTPITYLRRYNPELGRIEAVNDLDELTDDYAAESFMRRMDIECDAVTHNLGDRDGGRIAVLERRNFPILIFGAGKIVNSLIGVLSASGFSEVSSVNRVSSKDSSLKISEGDVAGGFVGKKDLGQSRKKVIEEIRDRASLFSSPKPFINNPKLIISIGNPSPDSLQRWMMENTPHLLVDIPVIPGKSPCARCVQLAEGIAMPISQKCEVSAAFSLSIASAIALDVISLADRNSSIYLSTSYIHSLRHYHQPEIQHWSQHHACGCTWS